jgi:hypothetical protein
VGASGVAASNQGANERLDPKQRGLERDEARPKDTVNETPNAEDREPVSAEELAAERP